MSGFVRKSKVIGLEVSKVFGLTSSSIGPSFAKGGTAGYLNSRYFTIYGGASEVQKDIVAKKVLGLTKRS